GGGDAGTASSSGTDGGTTGGSCASVPEETAGPYPGDGSNGPNALALSGVVRSDIRASLGGSSAVATGVPLGITLTLVDPVSSCAPVVGAAVYLWHFRPTWCSRTARRWRRRRSPGASTPTTRRRS